jgi:AcrR family transcriptional regulator
VTAPSAGRRTQVERSASTREAIIAAATRLFAERGFANTGIDEIARTAGVSKGALYHHYPDKVDVLAAAYEDIETRLVEHLGRVVSRASDPFDALRVGAHAFLDACLDPTVRRIALVEAPAGLGWERWREIDARHGFGLLQIGLQAAADAGLIDSEHLTERAHVLLAALIEASLLLGHSDAPEQARVSAGAVVDELLDGLRRTPDGQGSTRATRRPPRRRSAS